MTYSSFPTYYMLHMSVGMSRPQGLDTKEEEEVSLRIEKVIKKNPYQS